MKKRRRITKRDEEKLPDPYDGPGAVPVEKLAKDPDLRVKKRIVQRDGKYCVLAETSDRSFGCFATRAQASQRLRQVEAFAGKTKKAKKPAHEDKKSEDGSGGSKQIAKAPHVHTVRVGGAELVTSSNDGDPHSHRLTLPGGRKVTVGNAKQGPGHTHNFVVDGKTLTTSGPRNETDGAKKRKPKKKALTDLPDVLTFDAVIKGEMPALGKSGLPE
ncbi:MAG: hypothetical protein MI867_12010, partial [Pseudomonadales bacterium]|nr:hypothetical protein [Pseudomonadales bacterium]